MAKDSKKYPTEVKFILAEDLREETGKKLTLLGVIAGDIVILEGEEPGKALSSLLILAIGRGANGSFKFSLSLKSPSGEELLKDHYANEIESTIEEDLNLVIPLKLAPFIVKEFGEYTFRLKMDDRAYDYKFKITNK